jgi:hypothetical protein
MGVALIAMPKAMVAHSADAGFPVQNLNKLRLNDRISSVHQTDKGRLQQTSTRPKDVASRQNSADGIEWGPFRQEHENKANQNGKARHTIGKHTLSVGLED